MATRTFTHLYDSYDEAASTVQALEAAGVPHDDISLVANNGDMRHAVAGPASAARDKWSKDSTVATESEGGVGATLGTVVGGGAGLLTGLGLMAIPGVGPVVAAGWLVATLTGAGVGAAGGGLLGSLIHSGVSEDQANVYAEGVRRGGTLVTVRADDSQATTIETVLAGRTASAVDVPTRRTAYQSEAWTAHTADSVPYTPEELAAERARRTSPL